jgi:hypothetical protein
MAVTTEIPKFARLLMSREGGVRPRLQMPDGTFLNCPTTGEWKLTMLDAAYPVLVLQIPVELDIDTVRPELVGDALPPGAGIGETFAYLERQGRRTEKPRGTSPGKPAAGLAWPHLFGSGERD